MTLFLMLLLFSCEEGKDQPARTEVVKPFSWGGIDFDRAPGYYENDFELKISSTKEGELYYTLNGKTPQPGTKYTYKIDGPLNTAQLPISANYRIQTNMNEDVEKVYPWKTGTHMPFQGLSLMVGRMENGIIKDAAVATYIIGDHLPDYEVETIFFNIDEDDLFDPKKGIYVVGDTSNGYVHGKENYFKNGDEWERPCNFQYLNKKGEIEYTTYAGLSVHGLISQNAPQKSLKIAARKRYGTKKFKHRFFEDGPDQYKRLVLRSAFSGWHNGIYKDCFASELCKNLDLEVGLQKPVIVFINGEYWGIHFLAEKIDRFHLNNSFDLDMDEINICRDNGGADHGSSQSYNDLMAFMMKNDLKTDANYQHFKKYMDLDNTIDWLVAETFLQNLDWPCNNTKLWKSDSSDQWRNFLVDLDACFQPPHQNSLERLYYFNDRFPDHRNKCNMMYQCLLRNADFRAQFKNRYFEVLESEFTTERLTNILERYISLFSGTDMVKDHEARWGYPPAETFTKWEADMRIWVKERPHYAEEHIHWLIRETGRMAEEKFIPYRH